MVIPNQKGNFKKRSELYFDNGIEEELKNVLNILGKDIREDYLRHKDIKTSSKYKEEKEGQICHFSKTQEDIIEEINKVIEDGKNANSGKAISYLISLFADDTEFPSRRATIYDYYKQLLKDEIPEKKIITKWSNEIWKQCDNRIVSKFVKIVAEQKNIKTLSSYLVLSDYNQTIEWLDKFIAFLNNEGYESKLNTESILPNQNGDFNIKGDLFLDNGEIDEVLKEIAKKLGHDFREDLLDKGIFLKLPEKKVKSQEEVTEKISKLVDSNYKNSTSSDEIKTAFNMLFLWFNNNKELAKTLFADLYKNKHKLYDDNEIAENMQKASNLDEIMEEFGINDEKELRERLKNIKNSELSPFKGFNDSTEQDESIWKEIALFFIDTLKEIDVNDIETYLKLISQIKEGNILIKSGVRSNVTTPNSDSTIESNQIGSREYVVKITIEAIEKIVPYLNAIGYTFIERNLEHINIFKVKKNDKVFQLIMRPSNGKRYQLYQHERSIIFEKENELWLSDGFEVKQESLYSIALRMYECGATFIPTVPFLPGHRIM